VSVSNVVSSFSSSSSCFLLWRWEVQVMRSVIFSGAHGCWMNRTRSISRPRVLSSSASSGAKRMDGLIWFTPIIDGTHWPAIYSGWHPLIITLSFFSHTLFKIITKPNLFITTLFFSMKIATTASPFLTQTQTLFFTLCFIFKPSFLDNLV